MFHILCQISTIGIKCSVPHRHLQPAQHVSSEKHEVAKAKGLVKEVRYTFVGVTIIHTYGKHGEGNKIVALEEDVGKGHYRKQAGSQGEEEGNVDFKERLDASPGLIQGFI